MLTLKQIQENKEVVIERLKIKNFDATATVDQIIQLDNKRKATQAKADQLQAEMNALSKSIGQLFKEGKMEEANTGKEKTAVLKEQIKELAALLETTEQDLQSALIQLPNLPHASVPAGKSAEDNITIREGGQKPQLSGALPHWELAKKYDLIDFELGVKLTGAGFPVYKGKGAKLQRALIHFFLEEAIEAGYQEVLPPFDGE
jgi:seryl-tRNA synthetase